MARVMAWPKLTVSNYPEMLRKLSAGVFIITASCICVIRIEVAPVDQWLSLNMSQIKVFGEVSLPIGTVVVAFLAAVISEAIKLHDKISILFRIRKIFDCHWILIPMALCSGGAVSTRQIRRLSDESDRLMREVFYKYASSASDSKIDNHLLTQALTAWSWYWICVEAMVFIIPTAIILALYGQWRSSTIILLGIFVLQLIMKIFYSEATKYADAECSAILADQDRREAVKAIFDAL